MSRELDALVAERVMGTVWDDKRCRVCGWPIVPSSEPGCWASNCSMRPLPERRADEHRPYSTDIAAAWEVVEKMRTLKWWARIQSPFMADDDLYGCGFTPLGVTGWNGQPDHWTQDRSSAMAICIAALRAVGVDEATIEKARAAP